MKLVIFLCTIRSNIFDILHKLAIGPICGEWSNEGKVPGSISVQGCGSIMVHGKQRVYGEFHVLERQEYHLVLRQGRETRKEVWPKNFLVEVTVAKAKRD